jgi:hypothetical protein
VVPVRMSALRFRAQLRDGVARDASMADDGENYRRKVAG